MLDTCTRLLIIDFDGKVDVEKREIPFHVYSQSERFEIVKNLNPDAIICCGISEIFDKRLFSLTGFMTHPSGCRVTKKANHNEEAYCVFSGLLRFDVFNEFHNPFSALDFGHGVHPEEFFPRFDGIFPVV